MDAMGMWSFPGRGVDFPARKPWGILSKSPIQAATVPMEVEGHEVHQREKKYGGVQLGGSSQLVSG